MKLIDTHAHLDDPKFSGDLDEVLQRARETDVHRIVTLGIDLRTSMAAVELAAQYPNVLCAVGYSPHDASKADEEGLARMRDLARNDRVVAWGEVGLDYHYELSPRKTQCSVFSRQIELAKEMNLPLVFHFREAKDDFFGILKEQGLPDPGGIMHCFTGNDQELSDSLDLGLYISYSGIITFRKSADIFAHRIRNTPSDRILAETDCPYLAPEGHRGKRCEPCMVRETVIRIAEIRSEPAEESARTIWENAGKVFSFQTGEKVSIT